MGQQRRSFTPEFKQEAVDLCRRSGKSACQVARELGIPQPTFNQWMRQVAGAPLGSNSFLAKKRDSLRHKWRSERRRRPPPSADTKMRSTIATNSAHCRRSSLSAEGDSILSWSLGRKLTGLLSRMLKSYKRNEVASQATTLRNACYVSRGAGSSLP
jgi:hypothetical protein